jgi:hypothetical protein
MGNKLTTGEKRGLAAAVTAVALLILALTVSRGCDDAMAPAADTVAVGISKPVHPAADSTRSRGKKKARARKAPKVYPTRDPLSQPVSPVD